MREFHRGAEEFNAGKFFECHNTLEEVWRGVRGPGRDFFQGLIQVSVGFYESWKVLQSAAQGGERELIPFSSFKA